MTQKHTRRNTPTDEEPSPPTGPKSDCLIPPELPKDELHKLLFKSSPQETQEIKDYVEWQAHGEEAVLHAGVSVSGTLSSGIERAGLDGSHQCWQKKGWASGDRVE